MDSIFVKVVFVLQVKFLLLELGPLCTLLYKSELLLNLLFLLFLRYLLACFVVVE